MIQSRPQDGNGTTLQCPQPNGQNIGGNSSQAQQQLHHGNHANSQGTGNGSNQNNTSGPTQGNGYGQQGYNQRRGRFGRGKNGQLRNDGEYGKQGFPGFQNM